MFVLLFILLRESLAIDFRSQAYKSVDSYPNSGAAVPSAANNLVNPYLQFTPVFTQPPIYAGGASQYPYQQYSQNANSYVPSHQYSSNNQQPAAQVPSFPITELIQPNNTNIQQYQNPSWAQNTQNTRPAAQYSTTKAPTTTSQTTRKPSTRFTVISTTATPVVWTTTKSMNVPLPAKMSKLSMKPLKKEEGAAAHVSVPSHRLLNDILVIPSSRRLYILAVIPIHESADNQGFECGRVDVNGFIRLAAFLDALNQVNNQRVLKDAGLSLGAVIVDSCSSDLRTVADLYELLSGTNIQKTDLVAMIRDDSSHLPNVDHFARHLKIPVINTFFTAREQPLTTGTLPSMSSPLEAILDLLRHTESTCVSLLYDDLHEDSANLLADLSLQKGICLEQKMNLKSGGQMLAESSVRRMLLTEARIVVVLLGENNWVELMKGFRTEMVIAGRFILVTPQDPRWFTSKHFIEAWPHFDQLLMTVAARKPLQSTQLSELTGQFPKFPFPQHWLRQFWSTAFHCHIEGETENGQQFSKECGKKQLLNLTSVSPDTDIAPMTLAVHSIAHAMRKMVDNVCPGAMVQSLNDCLNDPQESLFGAILSLKFTHVLAEGDVYFNESSGYRDSGLVLNRILFDAQLEVEPIGEWDTVTGFTYTAPMELVMEERDGSRVPLTSTCKRSICASELARRGQGGGEQPTFREALNSAYLLIYTIVAVLAFFICMMCMYHQIVSSKISLYGICNIFCFGGLSLLCLVSILFVMPPNVVACAGRRIALSVALSTVFSPILVKTLAVWRVDLATGRRGPLSSPVKTSPTALFWICFGLVLIQAVIATEWSLFESPTELSFSSSPSHGHAWRCSPGNTFEHRMLNSCCLSGLMILITLVCSILSVHHVESRQNTLISVFAGLLALALYISLPMLSYSLRDYIMAGALVVYSFLVLLITYCRSAFTAIDGDSSQGSLVDKSTLDRSEKNWLENRVLSPRGGQTLSLQRNYHQATTLPQQVNTLDKYGVEGYAAPQIYSTHQGYGTHQTSHHSAYGIPQTIQRTDTAPRVTLQRQPHNSKQSPQYHTHPHDNYDATITQSHSTLPSNLSTSKYGQQEFVLEEEGGNSRL